MQKLKEATYASHQLLEDGMDIMRQDYSLADYIQYLTDSWGYYTAWEAKALTKQNIAHYNDIAPRSKVMLLQEDMREAGQADRLAVLPICTEVPKLETPEHLLGSFYVMEGASLGGRVLLKHIQKTLPDYPREHRFLNGYGDATGAKWAAFREGMERHSENLDHNAIIRSACDTFESLYNWYCRPR